MKIIRYLIVTVIVLAFSFLVLLQTQMAKNFVRDQLVSYIEQETGMAVEIGEVKLFPALQMTAYDVKVKDVVDVDVFHFGLFPLALYQGYLHFNTLILDGVTLHETEAAGGVVEVPIRVDIDLLKITNLKTPYMDDPIGLQGSVNTNPETQETDINLHLYRKSAPKQLINTKFHFSKNEGVFEVDIPQIATVGGNFKVESDGAINFEDIHGTGGPVTVIGALKLTPNLAFKETHFSITSDELPIGGTFFGELTLGGTVFVPEINMELFSQKIGTDYEDLSLTILSKQMQQGVGGEMTLKFTKEGQPFEFGGKMSWDTPFSPRLIASLELNDLLQLLGMDTTNVDGKIAIGIDLSREGPLAEFEIIDASFESYELGCIFTGINASIDISDNKLNVIQIIGQDDREGSFSGSGSMDLDPEKEFAFDFNIDMNNTRIIGLDTLKADTTGNLNFTGNKNQSTLEGILEADSVSFKLPEKSKAIRETLHITYINQPDDQPPPTSSKKKKIDWPLNLNIAVTAPKHMSIKGRGLTSDWAGDVVITGTPDKIIVNGELQIRKGQYNFRGKNFTLKEGTITFAGDLQKDTSIYIIAAIEIEKGTAEVIVKGSIRNPAISFRSNPPMSQREILSWLIFNRGASDISEFQGTQLNESITDLMKQVDTSPDILSRFQSSLGIDRIEFGDADTDGEGLSVQVSKHLGKDTYLTISRRRVQREDTERTTEANSVGIETTVMKNLKLQAEVDDGQHGQVNLMWKKDY